MTTMTTADLLKAYRKPWRARTDNEKAATQEYRQLFQRGRRFRLLRPAMLWGMRPHPGGGQQGWSETFPAGTILTCAGSSMTFGDGVPAVKWLDADGKRIANDCTFDEVVGGMWGGQLPVPGTLELVED